MTWAKMFRQNENTNSQRKTRLLSDRRVFAQFIVQFLRWMQSRYCSVPVPSGSSSRMSMPFRPLMLTVKRREAPSASVKARP